MGINRDNIVHTEEEMNTGFCISSKNRTGNDRIHKYRADIDRELTEMEKQFEGECTFYQAVCHNIRKIKTPSFLKPTGRIRTMESGFGDEDIDAPKFYFYAYIDKNTWSNMKLGRKGIQKESALKLVIALQLTEDDANLLLCKVSFVLNPVDYRDQIVIAILNSHCFDPEQASMVLEWYSRNGKYKFTNIYDI